MTAAIRTPRLLRVGADPRNAQYGLVALHGRGAQAQGMLSLAAQLGVPDVAVVAPQATGNSWWPTSFLASEDQMACWVEKGLSVVDAAIQALIDDGLRRDQIVITGFSQGACLALEYAARRGAGLRGVVGMSGALIGQGDQGVPSDALFGYADKSLRYDTDLSDVTAHIGLHEGDPHIPLKRARDSVDALSRLGADMSLTVEPGAAHGVLDADITALRSLLTAA